MTEETKARIVGAHCQTENGWSTHINWYTDMIKIMVAASMSWEDVVETVREEFERRHNDPENGCKSETHNLRIYESGGGDIYLPNGKTI